MYKFLRPIAIFAILFATTVSFSMQVNALDLNRDSANLPNFIGLQN